MAAREAAHPDAAVAGPFHIGVDYGGRGETVWTVLDGDGRIVAVERQQEPPSPPSPDLEGDLPMELLFGFDNYGHGIRASRDVQPIDHEMSTGGGFGTSSGSGRVHPFLEEGWDPRRREYPDGHSGGGRHPRVGRWASWHWVRVFALDGDRAQLPPGLALELDADPEARAVALDLARERGLRTLVGVLGG